MTTKRTNTHENIYRSARLRAAARNPLLSSMDTACDQVYISRRILWEIETGMSVPSSNVVLAMAEAYEAPELLSYFCSTDCPIGKARGFAPVTGMSLEAIGLNLVSLLGSSSESIITIVETTKDGVIDDRERTRINGIIDRINELNRLKDELLIAIER